MGRSLAILGLATPNFWLATMVIVFPAIWWRWSPPLVLVSFADDPLGSLAGFAIPSLILGTYLSAATMRVTRTMMLEVLSQDYIRTAWSKGLLERSVILRHAVKNALIPVVSLRRRRGGAAAWLYVLLERQVGSQPVAPVRPLRGLTYWIDICSLTRVAGA